MTNNLSRRQPPPIPYGVAQGILDRKIGGALLKFLKWCSNFYSSIPGGFKGTTPNTVIVGTSSQAGPGTEDASWMAANAQLVALTGQPSGLANANTEGTSSKAPRLDHGHKRDVRVKQSGADVGTRNAIDFSTDFTLTDDAGGDRVQVALNPVGGTQFAVSMFLVRRTG